MSIKSYGSNFQENEHKPATDDWCVMVIAYENRMKWKWYSVVKTVSFGNRTGVCWNSLSIQVSQWCVFLWIQYNMWSNKVRLLNIELWFESDMLFTNDINFRDFREALFLYKIFHYILHLLDEKTWKINQNLW